MVSRTGVALWCNALVHAPERSAQLGSRVRVFCTERLEVPECGDVESAHQAGAAHGWTTAGDKDFCPEHSLDLIDKRLGVVDQ